MGKKDGKTKKNKLSNKEYNAELERLHGELVKLQYWVVENKYRAIVIFEGRDAAGKGGVIKRITEKSSSSIAVGTTERASSE